MAPFGTVCSPCCAIYAVQRHVRDHHGGNEDLLETVTTSFYVDNCLKSLRSPQQAKDLLDRLRALLAKGGFEIRQANRTEVISHLPTEAQSTPSELLLTAEGADPRESTPGLVWHCMTDTLGYKCQPVSPKQPTMRNVYRVLTSQYDPLGYIIPFTIRAKVMVQALWATERLWDERIADELLPVWQAWEGELSQLHNIVLPRCYVPEAADNDSSVRQIHIFCDASEKASVAYLRVEDPEGRITVSFIMARSRVAPKRQQTMPRLEFCAALTGAQLAKVLQTELTLSIQSVVLWSDSTTVLSWIQSESNQYKVFVGRRVTEILDLTKPGSWRYVNTDLNPADDITSGKTLLELSQPNRWSQEPSFLNPLVHKEELDELRAPTFCGHISTASSNEPDPAKYNTWTELLQATHQSLHGAAAPAMSAADRIEMETTLLRRIQSDSFPEELKALKQGKPVCPGSRLSALSPEYDDVLSLIRVGGRLRKAESLIEDSLHPVVISPDHPITQLLVKDYNHRLHHAGPERIFAEIRRNYWILRGRQVIKNIRNIVQNAVCGGGTAPDQPTPILRLVS